VIRRLSVKNFAESGHFGPCNQPVAPAARSPG
jgi:hypothetical protein